MIEHRTENVTPDMKDFAIKLLARFGWQLVDSQEIYHEDTEIVGIETKTYGDGFVGGFMQGFTGKDGEINVKTKKTVTNYFILKFERDMSMKNYAQLKALNEELESKMDYPKPKKPTKVTAIGSIAVVLILISVIMAIVSGTQAELWEILICVLVPVIFIPIIVILWMNYKKKRAAYDAVVKRIGDILDQAEQLL